MHGKVNTDSIHLTSQPTLPPYRSINSVAVMTRHMQKLGIDAATQLSGSGIGLEHLDNPDMFVTPVQELAVIRKIINLAPSPQIGLDIGREYHVGIYGKQGAAAISGDTLLDAIKIAFRYISLSLTFFQHDLRVQGDLAFMNMKELIDLQELRVFVSERDTASMQRMAGDLLGFPLPFHTIRLPYPKPDHAAAYQDLFQCPVAFGAREHVLVFDSKYLFMPLPMANPLVRKTFEEECRLVSLRLQAQETAAGRVRHMLMQQPGALPSLSQLAQAMNMSSRTLRRRLMEEGTSYKALTTEVLKQRAIDLIEKTSDSIERIAAELGYHDLPNFYRAFKVWTGHNPSYFRKKT